MKTLFFTYEFGKDWERLFSERDILIHNLRKCTLFEDFLKSVGNTYQ